MNEYQQSLKIQRDNNSALNYARKEGRKELIARMRAKGMTLTEIAKLVDLSVSEIEALFL